jgi:phosphoglycerate dehydrogenase-like enzyme
MNDQIKVLTTVQFSPELMERIEAVSPRLEVNALQAGDLAELPNEAWEDVEVLYTHKLLPEPDQAPNLRWIQFHRAGNERFLDAPILRKPDLIATSLSGASSPQVAEHVLGMILG